MSIALKIGQASVGLASKLSKYAPGTARAIGRGGLNIAKGARGIEKGIPGVLKAGAKAVPYVGAGISAYGAYAGYNDARASGDDPGRAAFRGIGSAALGFLGGGGGTLAGGPLGGIAGGVGGSLAGDALGGAIYDNTLGRGDNTPLPAYAQPMTPEEQRQRRAEIKRRKQAEQPNMVDIGGFKYDPRASEGLVGLRMQQQMQNINNVQGYSTQKQISNNQLQALLGQQGVDRFGIGQGNQTQRYQALQNRLTEQYGIQGNVKMNADDNFTMRYGAGLDAGVRNNMVNSQRSVELGRVGNERYEIGQRYGNQRLGLQYEYGDRDKERGLKRYQGDQQYSLGNKQLDNAYGLGALNAFTNIYAMYR